jgi:hypothetical protein
MYSYSWNLAWEDFMTHSHWLIFHDKGYSSLCYKIIMCSAILKQRARQTLYIAYSLAGTGGSPYETSHYDIASDLPHSSWSSHLTPIPYAIKLAIVWYQPQLRVCPSSIICKLGAGTVGTLFCIKNRTASLNLPSGSSVDGLETLILLQIIWDVCAIPHVTDDHFHLHE